MAATTLHGVAPISTSLRGKVPGPSSSSSSRRVAAAVARLGRKRAHGSIVSLRPRPLVRGRVALGFTAPRAIASDKIPKSAETEADTAVEPSVVEKTSPGGSDDAPGEPTPPKSSAVIDVESLTSTASAETTPEPESDGGDGGEDGGSGGSGGGGDDGDHSSSDGSGGKAPGPELPESMVALASWAVSQTKDWSAAADGGLRAAFGTLVGVNCVTVMLIRSMRSRSEKKRSVKDDAKRAAAEAKNIAKHEEELAAMSKKREMAQVSASAGGSAIAAAATGASAARSSAPAFPPRERDTWDGDNEVLNSTGAGVGFATNNPVASVAATEPVEAIDASPGGVSFPKSDVDADEADDFLVRALESYDAADALIGGPSGADIALATNDNTATREDMLAFAVIPDDARDPRVVAALGDAARAQAAAANAMAAAAAATKRAAEATDAAQRLQRAIAAGATEAELAAVAAATSLAADRAVEEGSRAGYVTSGAGTVDRALNVAGEGIGRVAGAVARGVSVATPAVVDGARRYVPAGLDAVSRGVTTVWDGSVSSEGIRAPGLKQRALAFLNKVKQHQRGSAGAKAGVSSAEGTDGKDDVAAGAAV
jgi:hypothetical protein